MGGTGSGRPKNPPNARKMLKEIIPVGDIFEEDELVIYTSLVDIYMRDFDEDDLSSGDIDDIMTIATNKVLEIRLLKSSKGDAEKHMDVSTSIEKLRKQTEKIKENLSVRRRDRVDPNQFKGLSIVDLAVSFDEQKRSKMEAKARRLKAEQVKAEKELKTFSGNRYDVDSIEKKEDFN
jgi:hypothetical protein